MSASRKPKRPFSVTLTILGVVLLSGWNWGRVTALYWELNLLLDYQPLLDPRFRLIMAVMWGLVFGFLAWALWRRRPYSQKAVPGLTTIYFLIEISWRFIYPTTQRTSQNWVLSSLFAIVFILFTVWALNHPAANAYFKMEHTWTEK